MFIGAVERGSFANCNANCKLIWQICNSRTNTLSSSFFPIPPKNEYNAYLVRKNVSGWTLTRKNNMYQQKFNKFKNIENLAGKAWEHAVAIDVLATTDIKDCSIECFHYQQMVELFFKHLLETKSRFGSYSKSHQLQKLLEEVIALTKFRTNKTQYFMALQVITVCAEEYRYNFLLDCQGYRQSVTICDQLLDELLHFENDGNEEAR